MKPIFSIDIDGEIQINTKQKEGKHMSIYSDPILVTLSHDVPFITLQTYDEKHGKSQRFFLS